MLVHCLITLETDVLNNHMSSGRFHFIQFSFHEILNGGNSVHLFSTIGLGKDKCDMQSGDTPAPSHPWGRGGMGVVVLPALPQPRPALRLPASPQSCALLTQKPGLGQGVSLLLMLEMESPGVQLWKGVCPRV